MSSNQLRSQKNPNRNHNFCPYPISRPRAQNSPSNGDHNNLPKLNRRKYLLDKDEKSIQYVIHPYSIHCDDCPVFEKPTELGYILSEKRILEIEEKSKIKNGKHDPFNGKKYLVLPKDCTNLKFDLKSGYSQYLEHIPHQNGIDPLLKWIVKNKEKIVSNSNSDKKLIKPDFVCWRGLLTSLLNTPYERQNDLMFYILLYKGTYYLCEIETEMKKNERLNRDENQKKYSYWGYKFESYITADFPDQAPSEIENTPDPENNYSTVCLSSLSEHSLFYGAEIDCCLTNQYDSLNNYCEIKTSKGNSVKDLNFERNQKFFKWWLQSYLVDIQTIVVGMRDDEGFVNSIVTCNTNNIIEAIKQRSNPNLCFNFLKCFFDLVKYFCKEDDQIYVAKRILNSSTISIEKIDKESDSYNEKYFLRDWFKESF